MKRHLQALSVAKPGPTLASIVSPTEPCGFVGCEVLLELLLTEWMEQKGKTVES